MVRQAVRGLDGRHLPMVAQMLAHADAELTDSGEEGAAAFHGQDDDDLDLHHCELCGTSEAETELHEVTDPQGESALLCEPCLHPDDDPPAEMLAGWGEVSYGDDLSTSTASPVPRSPVCGCVGASLDSLDGHTGSCPWAPDEDSHQRLRALEDDQPYRQLHTPVSAYACEEEIDGAPSIARVEVVGGEYAYEWSTAGGLCGIAETLALAGAELAHALGVAQDLDGGPDDPGTPRCAVCGCTDDRACEGGCWWVEAETCSSCAELPADLIEPARAATLQLVLELVLAGDEEAIETATLKHYQTMSGLCGGSGLGDEEQPGEDRPLHDGLGLAIVDTLQLIEAATDADRLTDLYTLQSRYEAARAVALAGADVVAEALARAERNAALYGLAIQLGLILGDARTMSLSVDLPELRHAAMECARLDYLGDAAVWRGEDPRDYRAERDDIWREAVRAAVKAVA